MLRCIVFWTSFFDRFLFDFCSQLGLIGSQKAWRKIRFFWKIAVRSSHRFWIPFWLQLCFILASKIHQNLSKNRFQEALKSWSILRSIFKWFWLRFGGQVGAMLATFLGQRPPKRFPRSHQTPTKNPAQEKQKKEIFDFFCGCLVRLWCVFGASLVGF